MKEKKAYFFTALSILLWSTVASVFKLSLRELNPIQMVFYASIVSTVSLGLILLFQGKMRLLLQQSVKDILRSALMGFLNPFFYYLVLFRAYSLLPAQEAQPLNWTWPITLSLFSALFLKQKLSGRALLGIFVSFCGVLLISTRGEPWSLSFSSTEGVILAVSSSVIWALYWVINLQDKRDPIVRLFNCFIFGVVFIAAAIFLTGNFRLPGLAGAFGCIWIGLFEMGVTFIFWLKALELSRDSAKTANFAYLTPFISLIFIGIIVGERIASSSLAGLVLIVGGILVGRINQGRKNRQSKKKATISADGRACG